MPDLTSDLCAALADRYAIQREVGRGGMATVYLAQDVRHQRPVAVKVLHPELGVSIGPERFTREIEIVARLQHPHIVALYDSGRAANMLYYVMPYVEGESLRQKLEREKTLSIDEATRLARAVAAALDYAHRQHVIHRDVKPENVMLHHGEAMVTDFGIAKAASDAQSKQISRTGTALGTPWYMSPEQADGERELDGRTDVYALGAMLYEMLTGAPPFSGTFRAVMSRLFTDPVTPLRERGLDAPDWLEDAVQRALAKDPVDRFASAAQFANALLGPTTPAGLTTTGTRGAARSIAVLPFVNMSADPENEYFSDGIAEEIISALSKVQALRVSSRTSSFAFKGKNEDISAMGRKLKVTTVLEGSVRKSGNLLRVTAQLINVADGYHLWSERYDRQLEDVFAIQDEIAGAIVQALRVVLSDDEKRAIEKPPAEDLRAYEYYLRARQFSHALRRTQMEYARRMYERAIEIDPKYGRAYAGLADTCSLLFMYWDGSKANLDGADSASRKALDISPNLAEAHASRGLTLTLTGKYDEANVEFETALRLDATLYEAHYHYGRACRQSGRLEEAVQHFREAHAVRKEEYQSMMLTADTLRGLGRMDEAVATAKIGIEVIKEHLDLNPDDARGWYTGAAMLALLADHARALEWAHRALAIDSEDSLVFYNVACVYCLVGLRDEAVTTLDKAVHKGFGHREWLENDADLNPLRDDARFKALMSRM